jgi:hypothetical protein
VYNQRGVGRPVWDTREDREIGGCLNRSTHVLECVAHYADDLEISPAFQPIPSSDGYRRNLRSPRRRQWHAPGPMSLTAVAREDLRRPVIIEESAMGIARGDLRHRVRPRRRDR